MNQKICYILGMLCVLLFSSWGFYAHKLINETAVFTLPTEVAIFYKRHINIITERATDADKRCYVDSAESPRHYIDIEKYEGGIDSIKVHWSIAKEKFEERNLLARGIVPWQIDRTYRQLVQAFIRKDLQRIIKHSADLGHYVADAHVPLHTTQNYNGQYTGQIGIHAFWETRLPEMFASEYDLLVGRAQYIDDPLDYAWKMVESSHALVDSVLAIEKNLSQTTPQHLQKSYITRNNILALNYSDYYAAQYHRALKGMVARRMRASIHAIGSLWYSAWLEAGQPDLSTMHGQTSTPTDTIQQKVQDKIIGREEWH